MKISRKEFDEFDQKIMLDLLVGTEIRYAQRFFDKFSAVYRWILDNHPAGERYLANLYKELDPMEAREEILRYVETGDANSNPTIP